MDTKDERSDCIGRMSIPVMIKVHGIAIFCLQQQRHRHHHRVVEDNSLCFWPLRWDDHSLLLSSCLLTSSLESKVYKVSNLSNIARLMVWLEKASFPYLTLRSSNLAWSCLRALRMEAHSLSSKSFLKKHSSTTLRLSFLGQLLEVI